MKKENNSSWKYEPPKLIESGGARLAAGADGSGCGDDLQNTVPISCTEDASDVGI